MINNFTKMVRIFNGKFSQKDIRVVGPMGMNWLKRQVIVMKYSTKQDPRREVIFRPNTEIYMLVLPG